METNAPLMHPPCVLQLSAQNAALRVTLGVMRGEMEALQVTEKSGRG